MSWSVRKARINGEEVEFSTPEELKEKIIDKARDLGLARFDVKVNGEKVSPDEFVDKVGSAESLDIEVVSADKAA